MKIVFMGTPEFAVTSLQALLQSRHEVLAVVTAPDTMGGRGGKQLIQSAVKKYAVEHGLYILQPIKLRDKDFLKELKSFNADLHIVVAFRMLPKVVWNMPPKGTINVHGSLLPLYRGAAPIHWAVINGEKTTGVTIFRLAHEIDTGDLILQSSLDIDINETTGDVYQRLMTLGAETLIKSLDLLEQEDLKLISQDASNATDAPKLFHENAQIDFRNNDLVIHNFIRGMSPKPTAWMPYEGMNYFFYRSKLTDTASTYLPGKLFIHKNHLYLSTLTHDIEITEIQVEGKRIMSSQDFVNGQRNNPAFK